MFLLLLLLVFLIPLAFYCLLLAGINRRLHPLLVSGLWDCVGMLFAASGFFLVMIPGMLTMLYARSLRELPLEEEGTSAAALFHLWLEWWGIWLLYYVLLVAGIALLLLLRRNKTVVYNVNPLAWDKVFNQVVERLGLEQSRSGKRVLLQSASSLVEEETQFQADKVVPEATARKPLPIRMASLRIDPFPGLCSVTLHWDDPLPALREEVEAELQTALQEVETEENPAAAWFLGIGGSLAAMIFLIVLVLVLLIFFPPRRI